MLIETDLRKFGKFSEEPFFRKALGVRSHDLRVEFVHLGLELFNGCIEGLWRLVEEQQAGSPWNHRLKSPTFPIRNDGSSGGLGFHGDNAEVLFPREDQRPALLVKLGKLSVRDPAEEFDIR